MTNQSFTGDKKKGQSILGPLEKKIVKKYVDKIPKGIETYHLTLTTVFWCVGVIVFSYLARYNINWLWVTSLMIFLQYVTDLFDGAVGRHRNTGLIKWGFYMDHYLDYIFLGCLLIGYTFIVEDPFGIMFFVLLTLSAFMVNSFLAFAATNEFKIHYLGIGPTEMRLIFIIVNTLIIIFGRTYLRWAIPVVLIFSVIGLNIIIYRTQKYIWHIDMKNK